MNIFIIILNWNRPSDTIDCVKSVSKLKKPKKCRLNVLVVDNNSSKDNLNKLKFFLESEKKEERLNIELVENDRNLGFAEGNNVGIKKALKNGADYLLILNNDTIADKDLLTELIKAAEDNEKVAAVSPKIYFADGYEFHKDRYKKGDLGKIIWYAGGKIDWDNVYGQARGVDEVDKGQYDKIQETDFATGTCMFCKAESLKDVGLFDERYFMYYEDTDLSQRLKKAGWKVLYAPSAKLWHKVAQSSGIGSELNDYFTTRNRLLFGMGYAPLRAKIALYKESVGHLLYGREWQRRGVIDFYFANFGRGSWPQQSDLEKD